MNNDTKQVDVSDILCDHIDGIHIAIRAIAEHSTTMLDKLQWYSELCELGAYDQADVIQQDLWDDFTGLELGMLQANAAWLRNTMNMITADIPEEEEYVECDGGAECECPSYGNFTGDPEDLDAYLDYHDQDRI